MKYKEVAELLDGFNSLSEKYTKIVDTKPQQFSYDFSVENRWKIAKNTRILKKIIKTYQDDMSEIGKALGAPFLSSDQKGFVEYKKSEIDYLNKETEEFKLEILDKEDFNKKDDKGVLINPIPTNVLEVIMDYIKLD